LVQPESTERSTTAIAFCTRFGAAEQEQCFGEVDRSAVEGVEAVDEFAGVAVRVVAGDVEQCLGDRERGA
jgi:hypothetical protein